MNNILLYITTLLSFSSITHAMEQINEIQYTKNNFGDIFPQWQNIPSEHLTEKLSSFVNQLKDQENETPFIVVVPHEKAAALDSIKKAGFSFYHGNNEKTEWIFKNGSSIPEPYTASIGSGVVIRKNDTVLVVEEKTRRGFLGFPGGTTDLLELTRTTASRELQEELNLVVEPKDFTLFATVNRTNINRFNANGIDHYYVVDYDKASGDLEPNSSEIIRAFFAPLQTIADQTCVEGLLVYPAFAAMAKHLLSKNSQSHNKTFLDFRQLLKKEYERNHDDTMNIEFFAQ